MQILYEIIILQYGIYMNPFSFFDILDCGYAEEPVLAFSLCFTLRVAGKGTDRFYAWPDALAHRKGMVLCRF
ncbi:TPA: hypothetical protein ROX88_002660 [Bacillus pseudomycoides]|nr:hypothetical protein [Bacillus pseudomycoides]